MQRRFVSDVSHELRTPLTTVRMAGDVLHDARTSFDPVTARAAELLQHELDRFETLLGDLLEISRFDAGAAQLDLEDVNLGDVVRRVVDSTRVLAEQRGVSVVIEDGDGPSLAEADVRRVERILRNLVTNAIDHAEPDGAPGSGGRPGVVVRLASDAVASAIVVRDYGVGLQPGESAMVFNRFWRADPARARTSGGTGLGLAIALEDTHLHGGWLQAWGRPGQGAQFRLTLPRTADAPLRRSPLPLEPEDAVDTAEPGGAPMSDGRRLRLAARAPALLPPGARGLHRAPGVGTGRGRRRLLRRGRQPALRHQPGRAARGCQPGRRRQGVPRRHDGLADPGRRRQAVPRPWRPRGSGTPRRRRSPTPTRARRATPAPRWSSTSSTPSACRAPVRGRAGCRRTSSSCGSS